MASYYLDQNLPGGTGATGTSIDPFGKADLPVQLSTLIGTHTIYMKGEADYNNSLSVGTSSNTVSLVPWTDVFRIKVNAPFQLSIVNLSVIKGAILEIDSNNVTFFTGSLLSCFIRINGGYSLYVAGGPQSFIKGCVIIGKFDTGPSICTGNVIVKDSIIDGIVVSPAYAVADNCCFSAASLPVGFTSNNGQVGWTPPAWPAWNAAQNLFASSLLAVGVNTPPQPGNAPYTGYEAGLFGTARSGIGGVYFGSVSGWEDTLPLDGMAVYNKDTDDIFCYNGTAWIENFNVGGDHKVLTSGADPAPGYLVAKLEAGMALALTEVIAGSNKAKFDVQFGTLSNQACVGNDSRLSDDRTPLPHASTHEPEGDDAMTVDAAPYTGSLRTLGTLSNQAAAGDDARFKWWLVPVLDFWDASAGLPSIDAIGDRYICSVSGNGWTAGNIYTATSIVPPLWEETVAVQGMEVYILEEDPETIYGFDGSDWVLNIAIPDLHASTHDAGGDDELAIDAAPATGSLRTLGTLTNQACAGSDFRLSNARTPTAHAVSHNAGGGDPMTIDAAPATGSLRTLGTLTNQACAGSDSRLSDARTPTAHASTHNAGGSDAMAIDSAPATGSLRTLGTLTNQACAGSDSRLSDARTPVAHASSHNLGGSDIIIGTPRYLFYADQLLSPNNADWAVNAAAGVSADSLNNSLLNRQFDDTAEEGVGFFIEIPASAVNMTFYFRSRAQTAPGGATTVLPRLYRRQVVDNTAIGAWSASFAFAQIDIPANTRFQYDSETVTLATLGLTAGNVVQFELTRNPADGLTGDWNLLELCIYFG
jgi:hypothetical protein